ncbi:MAG: right-handed parallel beta-helix repeat-containing protein [Armatimonadota bacterium]
MLRVELAVGLLCIALLTCSVDATRAATLHVAKDGAAGDPGTAEQPLATIAEAVERAGPGDTIRVHEGRWSETIAPGVSGEADAPIVLEGERGPDGEWLTVLDIGVPVTGWEPAPEVGEGVFKTDDLGFVPYSMTLDGKQILRIFDRRMTPEGGGFDLLALPPDGPMDMEYGHLVEEQGFWDGIEVIYGAAEGMTYIRFRHGDDPTDMKLLAAPGGGGIRLQDVSHWTIRDIRISNAEDCVVIEGEDAHDNIVERCFLSNGHNRVVITAGAAHNSVRENEMTLNYFGYDDPGAWGAAEKTMHTSIRCRIYLAFKHIQGPNASDDRGVLIRRAGPGNEVAGNHIYAGLIGISLSDNSDTRVHRNVIHGMSSIGVLTSETAQRGSVDLRVHDNLVYDCNINFRLHHYNNCLPEARREYLYRNLSWQPEGLGSHIYVHWTSREMAEGAAHPELYLYHNTFAGGRTGFSPSGWSADDGGNQGIWLLNNIFSATTALAGSSTYMSDAAMMGPVDYNLIAGAINHGGAEWVGGHTMHLDEPGALWALEAMPDFELAEDSPARGLGLDLSRPFEVMGRRHDALPGMEPGYFDGDAPDAGALQFGEQAPVDVP